MGNYNFLSMERRRYNPFPRVKTKAPPPSVPPQLMLPVEQLWKRRDPPCPSQPLGIIHHVVAAPIANLAKSLMFDNMEH